jgi:hypothetical protein
MTTPSPSRIRANSPASPTVSSGCGRRTGWPTSRVSGPTEEAGEGCPFCAAPTRTDAEGLIVHRGELCYVVMNLFPYNPGHVLICPYRHVPRYVDLTDDETIEFTLLTKTGGRVPWRPRRRRWASTSG